MLYVLLFTLWYANGTYYAGAKAYVTQRQCDVARGKFVDGAQRGMIDGVQSLEADCVSVSNPDTAQHA